MTQTFKTPTEAKVAGRNLVNALANQLSPAIFEALKPYVGVKCFNQGQVISERLRKVLPTLPNTVEASASYSTGHGYSLTVTFRVTTMHPDRLTGEHCNAIYSEEPVYLADIDRQGLTIEKLYEQHVRRTDFTVDEVKQARADLRAAQSLVSQAQSRLVNLGEHDNF